MKDISVLVLGDVVGQPGCRALFFKLPGLIKKYKTDFVIVNGENASDGFGILPEEAEKFFSKGTDVITSGNHIWQKREIYPLLEKENTRILRPANYPPGVPGKGDVTVNVKGIDITVINLLGRVRMGLPVDCPFRKSQEIIKKNKKNKIIIVDFHAEDTMEKEALAWYLDGKVSALIGTHTHIQTADERILPKGSAYITDIGMTGPDDSVIGTKPEISIRRSLTQLPLKMEVADNQSTIKGVLIKIDIDTGKALSIERINVKESENI
ncbi:MAG: TIGR00282 family metallophosphoesterase [Spirochaetaceae bacterium]|jgi:metallophosphoesterase (TIGR00282 family)|nr:TIGR00282 family metallophosphoesterase [Spirochaetaceae bacterium]